MMIAIICGGLFSPYDPIANPFTSQQFAANIQMDVWGTRGSVSYYRKTGFLLHSPVKTEYGEILDDNHYLSVSRDKIYVNTTFMGDGAAYQINNDHIDLMGKVIDQFVLRKENDTSTECLELTGNLLRCRRGDEEISCPLTEDQYKQLRYDLERLKLSEPINFSGNNTDKEQYNYTLSVAIENDSSSYYSYVDGEKVYELMYQFIMSSES